MALITQAELIAAAEDAETLEKVINDPADQSNPGHPDGTVTTRLDETYYNVQASLKAITDFCGALKWSFDDSTTMADPTDGNLRLNNAAIASVTSIAISDTDKDSQDVSAYVNSWDNSTDANKGALVLRSYSGAFAIFTVTSLTDNSDWSQVDVTYVSGSGTFEDDETIYAGFSRTGDTGGITAGGANTFTGSNTFNGAFALYGAQSETLAAETDDLALDATANTLNIDLTGDQTLNGLTGGANGRIVVVTNIDATESLTLTHDDAGSTAANRFSLPSSQSFVVLPGHSVTLKYASSRWGLIAQTFAVGTSSGNLVEVQSNGRISSSLTQAVDALDANASSFAWQIARPSSDAVSGNIGSLYLADNFQSDTLGFVENAYYDETNDYYTNEEQFVLAGTGTIIGDMTLAGGNAAAFDGVTSQVFSNCARKNSSPSYVGKSWGSGNGKIISRYVVYGSSDGGMTNQSTFDISLQGSDTGAWGGEEVTLHTASGVTDSNGIVTDYDESDGVATTTGYEYHRVVIDSGGENFIAEVQFYETFGNMTLRPTATTISADAQGVTGHFLYDPVDSVTLGTDVVIKFSIDGGSTYATADVTEVGVLASTGKTLFRGTADVSAQSGTSLIYEFASANGKILRYTDCAALKVQY